MTSITPIPLKSKAIRRENDLSEGVAMTPRGWIQMIAADFR
jgi:hypothetical protein